MIKRGRCSTRLLLVLALVAGLIPEAARADDGKGDRSIQFLATASTPIGRVYSLGEVLINGRAVYGEQMILGNELLQVPDDASASVMLDSIGQVVLLRGAAVRLATGSERTDDNIDRRILIVSLIGGGISVNLQQNAGVYLEACESAFTATRGASFRVEIREDQPLLTVWRGAVESHNQDTEYIVEPVIADPQTGRPIRRAPSTRRVTASKGGRIQTEEISVQVKVRDKKTNRTIPARSGRRVAFALLKPDVGVLGSQSIIKFTNDFGVATATFTAGPNLGETGITATDEASGAKWEGKIIVGNPPGFLRKYKIPLGVLAALTIILIIEKTRDSGPLRQEPPPTIP